MRLEFTKMHGAGNDFILVDATRTPFTLNADAIRRLAARRTGIGFDQLLVVEPTELAGVDFKYRIFNADGGEVQMCGNGARCFAVFVHEKGLTDKRRLRVETQAGIIEPELIAPGEVRVAMGRANFSPAALPFIPEGFVVKEAGTPTLFLARHEGIEIPFAVASMGNPHAVCFVHSVKTCPAQSFATYLQQSPAFPEGVNVGFLEVLDAKHGKLRVVERGAGETLACGTGASAAFAVAQRLGFFASQVALEMRGGRLELQLSEDGGIELTGPAQRVFEGVLEL